MITSDTTMMLLQMIARQDERSLAISRVVCRLVLDGGELGELETGTVVVHGEERPFKVMPKEWIDRLVVAAQRGAFERMAEDRIVERLLSPPVPA